MKLSDLRHLLRGVPADREINFRVVNENEFEMAVTLTRVEVLRFADSSDDCDSAELVFFAAEWDVKP